MQITHVPSQPIVMPLPPMDYRVASTTLHEVASTTEVALVSSEWILRTYWEPLLGALRPQHVESLDAAVQRLPSAVGQARRAAELLRSSSVVGAGAAAASIEQDVLDPLQRVVDSLPPTFATASRAQVTAFDHALSAVSSAASAWATELGRQETVVHPAARRG